MGGQKISDALEKKIYADYISCQNYRETARINGVSDYTVRSVVKRNKGNSVAREIAQKQEENTQDTLTYMAEQHESKKRIISKLLKAIENKCDNVDMFTSVKDLATAYGIIVDKELKFFEAKAQIAVSNNTKEADNLSKALEEIAGDLDADQQ